MQGPCRLPMDALHRHVAQGRHAKVGVRFQREGYDRHTDEEYGGGCDSLGGVAGVRLVEKRPEARLEEAPRGRAPTLGLRLRGRVSRRRGSRAGVGAGVQPVQDRERGLRIAVGTVRAPATRLNLKQGNRPRMRDRHIRPKSHGEISADEGSHVFDFVLYPCAV